MSATARHVLRLRGYAADLPTPYDDAGEVDRAALERLCQSQVEEGAAALIVCGAAGEGPTLGRAEHDTIVRTAVAASHGRIPVIADASSNATVQAIELARDAERAGADAVLAVVPYYNKPTQSGMYAHFRAIAEAIGLPIILQDVPARTVCTLADDTIARLAEMPQCIGLADATGDVSRPLRLRVVVGSEFRLLSGDDATALALLAHGGDGCISVVATAAPGLCRAMYSAWKQGEIARAQQLAASIARLAAALARESSPAPLKYALSMMNLMSARVRLPLVEVKGETRAEIEKILAHFAAYSGCLIGDVSRHDRNAARFTECVRDKPKLC